MKEIYLINCHITGEAIALSNRPFGEYPQSVKKNPLYLARRKRLKEENSRAIFKLIDLVKDSDAELIYQMYLDQFKGWNIPLLNFYERQNQVPEAVQKTSILELKIDKYLMNDLPNVIYVLRQVHIHFQEKSMSTNDRILMYELILLCALNSCCETKWGSIRSSSISQTQHLLNSLLESESSDCRFLAEIFSYLKDSPIRTKQKLYVFSKLRQFTLERILSILNYVLAFFQHQLIFNKNVWHNAFELRMYLLHEKEYNWNYQIVELYNKITRNKSKQIEVGEFNEMTNRVYEFSSKN